MRLINKKIRVLIISFSAYISSNANAWVPCMPICDLMCMGLTMTLQTSLHTSKIFQLKLLKLKPAERKAYSLHKEYESYGDDVKESWRDGFEQIEKEVLRSTIFQKSYTDRINSALSGASTVFEASFKGASRVEQDLNLDLQNVITRVASNSLKALTVALEHPKTSNLDPKIALLPKYI